MSTIEELVAAGALTRIEVELDPGRQPFRRIFGLESFVKFLESELPTLEPVVDRMQTMPEQLDDLLHEFISGGPLPFNRRFKPWRRTADGVWYLKTIDLRIFGWFSHIDTFIAAFGSDATKCKDHNLYNGFVGQTVRLRTLLPLDEPKCIFSGDPNDVLSFPN